MKLKTPIMLALDLDDWSKARVLVKELSFGLGAIKIGPRLLMKYGSQIVQELAHSAPVFVDNKYYDIPNTMESAVRATFEAGATFVTVHASAGSEALERLAALEKDLNQKRPFKILAVTVLTSFSEKTLPPVMIPQSIDTHVRALAQLALNSGITGIVCSPHEIESLATLKPTPYLVTPGIRGAGDKADDQKRTLSAQDAMFKGASALVIGRPIIEAASPLKSLEGILRDIAHH